MITPSPLFAPALAAPAVWALTSVLLLAFPVYAFLQLRPAKMAASSSAGPSKLPFYLHIITLQWILLGAMLWVAHACGLTLRDLGQWMGTPWITLATTVLLSGLVAGLQWLDYRKHASMSAERLDAALAPVRKFIPNGRRELVAALLMAVTAGVCEELLYRGWLLNLASAASGSVWIGLVLSSIAFGIAHAYQGWRGMLATGVIGLVFGLIYIFSGNLIAVQLLHAVVDAGGVLAGATLMGRVRVHQRHTQAAASGA